MEGLTDCVSGAIWGLARSPVLRVKGLDHSASVSSFIKQWGGLRWPQRELITAVFMLLTEVGVHLVLLQLPLINVQLAAPARDPK